jgi:hypothetical protein
VLAVLLLGINPWAIGLLWPALGASVSATAPALRGGVSVWSATAVAALIACLLPLLLGAAAHGAFGIGAGLPRWVAGGLWLALYPAALAAGLALGPDELVQPSLGPVALALLCAALCAYGAAAAQACAESTPELAATRTALGNDPWDAPEVEHRGLQRAIVALCVAGAAAIAVIAPAVGGPLALETAWGDGARAGGVLTAVVAAALGVAAIGVFLGGGLRADGASDSNRPDAPLRAAWFLFLALLGAVTYFVVG